MQQYTNEPQPIASIPQVASLNFNPMAKNYPLLTTLESLFFWLMAITALSVADFLVEELTPPIWVYSIFFSLSIISLIVSYFSAKAKGYVLRQKDLIYREGLFWKKRTGVSFKRVQHIDITHGPIERKFKLASIKLFTAGGALADLKISGLPKADAETLRSFILENTGVNDE